MDRAPAPPKRALQRAYPECPLEKRCLTAAETCVVLSISRKTLQRLETRGLLKPLKVLRTKLYTREAIENFIQECQ